jgi:hypothetical protein
LWVSLLLDYCLLADLAGVLVGEQIQHHQSKLGGHFLSPLSPTTLLCLSGVVVQMIAVVLVQYGNAIAGSGYPNPILRLVD